MNPLIVCLCLVVMAVPLFAQEGENTPSVTALNGAVGLELWQDENLFDDEAEATAKRLRWPRESKTRHESSYRKYASGRALVLGVPSYSLALYGSEGQVAQVSIVLTNKGDVGGYHPETVSLDKKLQKEAMEKKEASFKALSEKLEEDNSKAETALTALLGKPQRQNLGQGKEVRERVSRWDVGTQSILLCFQKNEYLRLVIMPAEDADNGGRPARINTSLLKQQLLEKVERRPNGDVLIHDLPMVNQGNKGYCGPATFERILRHVGNPVDMYVLAMAAGTEFGGGTAVHRLFAVAGEIAQRSGRETGSCRLELKPMSKLLDQGVPMVWTMFIHDPLEKETRERSRRRQQNLVTAEDAEKWNREELEPLRKVGVPRVPALNGHFRMIVGYNAATREIATSDSWGNRAETWIMIEEAEAMNQAPLCYLAP